jgi:hypothetical protein
MGWRILAILIAVGVLALALFHTHSFFRQHNTSDGSGQFIAAGYVGGIGDE